VTTIINGSSPSITFSDGSAQTSATRPFLNRIINGGMVIDQRNAGASVTPTDAFTLDRWDVREDTDGAISIQQISDAPAGFSFSARVTTTTADASLTGTQRLIMSQPIEGFNTADLMFGSATAQTVTLSFWVKSSLTGTFAGSLQNSARNRSYVFNYTISAANTWEYKTITIAGDTTGTWIGATNGIGIRAVFSLGVGPDHIGTANSWQGSNLFASSGAVSVIGTLNATWQVTGVQLEVGSTATSFDYRPYGTELALCQRYFVKLGGTTATEGLGAGNMQDANNSSWIYVKYPVTMRAAPTASYSSLRVSNNADYDLTVNSIRGQNNGIDSSNIGFNTASGGTQYYPVQLQTSATAGFLAYSAEL
jgi:hypothetical protein